MGKWGVLAKFELKNLVAGKGVLLALGLVTLAGAYGIYYGKTEMDGHRRVLSLLPEIQNETDFGYINTRFKDDEHAGRLGYYFSIPTRHEPTKWASLSIGQRDVNPYFLKIRLLGIQGQLYDSGMENPLKSLSGNFDLSFVYIFLFPLLIIGLSYNLISGEADQGTLRILRSLSTSLLKILTAKLAVRFALIYGLGVALFLGAMAYASIPLDGRVFVWLLVLGTYFLFWFGVSFLVAALGRSSAFNATVLLGSWLLLTIVAPAIINVAFSTKLPVPHGFELSMKQRQVMNNGWDKPKEATFEKFFLTYPEWKDTPPVTGRFHWKWYFAMHQVADDSVKGLEQSYFDALRKRQSWSERLSLFSPPVATQLIFNKLARTDLSTQVEYLESIRAVHERLKAYFYPPIFNDRRIPRESYLEFRNNLPKHNFAPEPPGAGLPKGYIPLLLSALLLLAVSPVIFLRREEI